MNVRVLLHVRLLVEALAAVLAGVRSGVTEHAQLCSGSLKGGAAHTGAGVHKVVQGFCMWVKV